MTASITKEKMLPLLVESSPGFAGQWEAFQADWKDEEAPLYVVLGDFARYLIDKHEKGETSDFDAIFNVVERLHIDGDAYVQNAVAVGLLEGMQNSMRANDSNPEVFVEYLQAATRESWNKLNTFWNPV